MDRDELREMIAKWLYERDYRNSHIWMDWNDASESYMKLADEILSLLAPELEKARFWDEHVKSLPEIANNIKQLRADAEKWRKVKEIAKTTDCYPICPFVDFCANSDIPCCFGVIVDALEGEGEKG